MQEAETLVEPEPLKTVDDLTRRWQCSRAAVYKFVEDERLTATRIGGRMLRFRPQDIEAFERAK
jgi:excisionase family DNA binding protein